MSVDMWRCPPYTTLAMVLACTTVTAYYMLQSNGLHALCQNEFAKRSWWYSALIMSFAHDGLLHWALNMLGLLSLGSTLERSMGSEGFLRLYIFALFVVCTGHGLSALLHVAHSCVVGCSGVIFALFTYLVQVRDGPVNFYGWVDISPVYAPWAALVLTQLMCFHFNVSFVGHTLGILAGLFCYYCVPASVFSPCRCTGLCWKALQDCYCHCRRRGDDVEVVQKPPCSAPV